MNFWLQRHDVYSDSYFLTKFYFYESFAESSERIDNELILTLNSESVTLVKDKGVS